MRRSFLEGRLYIYGRALNLNRLSNIRKNVINPHSQPNSVFAYFLVVCIFNWILGQLKKTVERSYLKGRTVVEELRT